VFFVNLIELVFFIVEFCYYRDNKIGTYNYIFQRLAIVFTYNAVILVESQVALLICVCLFCSLLFGLKCYGFYVAFKLKERPEIEP
jgi:hypothetical protein